MSNEIYGFADFLHEPDVSKVLNDMRDKTPLGIFLESEHVLLGFPVELRPTMNSIVFVIGDSPESKQAEYLLDNRDYDPQAIIRLPLNAEQRLSLFTEVLSLLLTPLGSIRIAVCLTQCNQVDSVEHLKSSQLIRLIKKDCLKESPPCKIYVITP